MTASPTTKEIRMTRQRRIIMEELGKTISHPTADEVYGMVRKRLPKISLGTVYRNLEVLSAHGMIRKLELAGSQRRFDGDPENHYHARCLSCGRLEDVPIEPIVELDEALDGWSEYEIVGHRLEFIGLCPHCKKHKETASPHAHKGRERRSSDVSAGDPN